MSERIETAAGARAADPVETLSVEICREFRTSCETLYRCFTVPRHLAAWFGPKGVTCQEADAAVDLRVGGHYRIAMSNDAGAPVVVVGRYLELNSPHLIRMTWRWEHIPSGPDSLETRLTLHFDPIEGGTRLRLVHDLFGEEASRVNHLGGWESSLECLAEVLASLAAEEAGS